MARLADPWGWDVDSGAAIELVDWEAGWAVLSLPCGHAFVTAIEWYDADGDPAEGPEEAGEDGTWRIDTPGWA